MDSIRLQCDTEMSLDAIEAANISYVPCGTIDGKDQPLLKFAHLWGERRQITRQTYGKKWNAHNLSKMTGVQLFTGYPTYRPTDTDLYLYYNSLDIEAQMLTTFPTEVDAIVRLYKENLDGTPCILETKSAGLRLDAYTLYGGPKISFKDSDGRMLFEILCVHCMTRMDNRYAMVEGSILKMPTLPKKTLQEIYHIINEISTQEQHTDNAHREVVEKSQVGNLAIEWDSKGRSQLFPTEYCQRTTHISNRNEVRFSKSQGGIDGKCFNCGEVWWEVPPREKATQRSQFQPRFNPRFNPKVKF